MTAYVRQREKYNSLNDQMSSNKKEKANKAEAINNLRRYLFINKLKLKGTFKNSQFTFGNERERLPSTCLHAGYVV